MELSACPRWRIRIMPIKLSVELPPPTYRSAGEQRFVGLAARRRMGEATLIPAQWKEFMAGPYQQVPDKLEGPPVGINLPTDRHDEFVYVCGAPVSRFSNTPSELSEVVVPPADYAVFAHDRHVSELPQTYRAIRNEWFPASGEKPGNAASLEHHNSTFDPRTGMGGVTIWIPLAG
jgi:AraC family transcriptional regulator